MKDGSAGAETRRGARLVRAALALYKRTLSPVFAFFGARCRHWPSCSDYAAAAFERHGAVKGGVLTISRLCRCHPLGSHGIDPVPEHLPDAGWRLWRYGDWAWTERHGPCPEQNGRSQNSSPSVRADAANRRL